MFRSATFSVLDLAFLIFATLGRIAYPLLPQKLLATCIERPTRPYQHGIALAKWRVSAHSALSSKWFDQTWCSDFWMGLRCLYRSAPLQWARPIPPRYGPAPPAPTALWASEPSPLPGSVSEAKCLRSYTSILLSFFGAFFAFLAASASSISFFSFSVNSRGMTFPEPSRPSRNATE